MSAEKEHEVGGPYDDVTVAVWSDFLCPWCRLGASRVEWMLSQGVTVEWRPYELYPQLPPSGLPARAIASPGSGERRRQLERIAGEEDVVLHFPEILPNTHKAHEAVEWARDMSADAGLSYHRAVFDALWEHRLDIMDAGVLVRLAVDTGLSPADLEDALGTGRFTEAVADARRDGVVHGVNAAPSFLVQRHGAEFVVPGLQSRDLFHRVFTRLGS